MPGDQRPAAEKQQNGFVDHNETARILHFLAETAADLRAVRARLMEELDEPSNEADLRGRLQAAVEALAALQTQQGVASSRVRAVEEYFSPSDEQPQHAIRVRHFSDWPPRARDGGEQLRPRDLEAEWKTSLDQEGVTRIRAEFARMRRDLVSRGAERASSMSEAEVAAASFDAFVSLVREGRISPGDEMSTSTALLLERLATTLGR